MKVIKNTLIRIQWIPLEGRVFSGPFKGSGTCSNYGQKVFHLISEKYQSFTGIFLKNWIISSNNLIMCNALDLLAGSDIIPTFYETVLYKFHKQDSF